MARLSESLPSQLLRVFWSRDSGTSSAPVPWKNIVLQVVHLLTGEMPGSRRQRRARRRIHQALDLLKREIQKSLGGTYCLRSFEDELYLSASEKAEIVAYALFCFESSRELLEPLRDVIDAPRTGPADETRSALNAFQNGCKRFVGLGPDVRTVGCAEFCHYIPLDTFLEYVSYKDSSGAYHSASGDAWLQEIERTDVNRSPDFLSQLQGTVREHVFSTLGEWIDACKASGAELTEKVRDELGCPHFEGRRLVELRFAVSSVRTGKLKKPTFADADAYPPFLPSRWEDPYGYARHLRRDDERGGPEVWHRTLLSFAVGCRLLPKPEAALPGGVWQQIADNARRNREAAQRARSRTSM